MRQLLKRQCTRLRSIPNNIEADCLAPSMEKIALSELKRFVLR